MLFDSDLDEDDIEVLKECLEKAKKPKKSNKMSQVNSNNSKGLAESNCIDVLPFQNEKPKPRKRKLENAEEFNHSPEKSKKRKLNYRLERLIKVKSRRTTVPEDPKLSPLYSEKEMKWNRFEIDKKIQSEEDDDSGIESVKSSTSTCTTDNVQTCNTNSIQYNNKIKGNCEICLQKISYSCTCLVQNSQDSKKIQQDCDIEINTTSIVSNPSHIGFPSRYKIPPPDLIVALDCEFVGVHPKNTSALGIMFICYNRIHFVCQSYIICLRSISVSKLFSFLFFHFHGLTHLYSSFSVKFEKELSIGEGLNYQLNLFIYYSVIGDLFVY